MSETFRCDDKEMLVAYLYGEIEPDGRREVERHLRTCAACTREVESLNHVRHDLQAWVPPDRELALTITQTGTRPEPAAVLTSPRWATLRELPRWAQVAAAVLVFGVGAAIANVQVRSTADGFIVSTGWLPVQNDAAVSGAATSEQEWRNELAALEQSLRRDIAAQQAAITQANAPQASEADADTDMEAVLQRVQSMIEASEKRQRQELALRLTLAERSWNQRELANLTAIHQRMSSLQGRTFAVEASQQEMINRLRRVSLTPNQ